MKTIRRLLFLIVLLSFAITSYAQQKYAVLITGDYAATAYPIPISDQWNGGQGKGTEGYQEFWNDTYLMWEMLQTKGYSRENIFVLFAGGNDFPVPYLYAPRYTPPSLVIVTDFSATIANVTNVFNGLRYGTGGFPQITQDDFLFVWTFDHGSYTGGHSTLYLIDGIMTDTEFASLVNPISADKKVFWMEQCHSGGFVDDLEGPIILHTACQINECAHPADNQPYLENEVIDYVTYYHGEFDFHIYSSTNGSSPDYNTNYGNESFSDADWNGDNYISIEESFDWESTHESNNYQTSVYSDPYSIGYNTSLEYPTLLNYNIDENETHKGIIGIACDIHVSSGNELTFLNNANIYLLNNAKLVVNEGATLTIQDGVKIYGNGQNSIRIEGGSLNLGQNVLFSNKDPDQVFHGLYLGSLATPTQISHATFHRAHLWNESSSLTLDYCTIEKVATSDDDRFGVFSTAGNVSIFHSEFNDASVYLSDVGRHSDCQAKIQYCIFDGGDIYLDSYRNFNISFNNVTCSDDIGIILSYAGNGTSENQLISNNTIHNSVTGLFLNNTYAKVYSNNIHDNEHGVYIGNSSHISSLSGSPGITQTIKDCLFEELHIDKGCFPVIVKYNQIIDDDNQGGYADPLLRYINYPPEPEIFDITNNCWGNNFNPESDLFGVNVTFNYMPTWCPGDPPPIDPPDLYSEAITQLDSGNYVDAKSTFLSIINQFPKTTQAQAAMKELFQIEEFVENDYLTLQQFYLTNDSIVADSSLSLTGNYLANRCNEKLQNWPDEISWYENRIMNPRSETDSIFAILDLCYLYLLMEYQNTKDFYVGNLPQYKLKSIQQFIPYRDSLIALLPCDQNFEKLVKTTTGLNEGELFQNVPNPVVENTDIYYKIHSSGEILITISNIYNQIIREIYDNNVPKGIHKVHVSLYDFQPGIYFYTLIINGKKSDVKKLIVSK